MRRSRIQLVLVVLVGAWVLVASLTEARPRQRGPSIVVGKPRPARHEVVVKGTLQGTLDMNVKPKSTEVWIDGQRRGLVDQFDGRPTKLHLTPGMHTVKLITPDGLAVEREVRVTAGNEIDIGLDLR